MDQPNSKYQTDLFPCEVDEEYDYKSCIYIKYRDIDGFGEHEFNCDICRRLYWIDKLFKKANSDD